MEILVGVKLIIRILYNAHIWYKIWFCNKGVVSQGISDIVIEHDGNIET